MCKFIFESFSYILPNLCWHASFKIFSVHIFLICWKMKTEETLTNFLKSAQYLSARLLQTLRCAHLSDLLEDEKWRDVDQVVKFCWSVQRKKKDFNELVPAATTRVIQSGSGLFISCIIYIQSYMYIPSNIKTQMNLAMFVCRLGCHSKTETF